MSNSILGHVGVGRTIRRFSRIFYGPGLYKHPNSAVHHFDSPLVVKLTFLAQHDLLVSSLLLSMVTIFQSKEIHFSRSQLNSTGESFRCQAGNFIDRVLVKFPVLSSVVSSGCLIGLSHFARSPFLVVKSIGANRFALLDHVF
ncbi:hypothetical protein PHYBLDRAFT_138076 [Phycomyces blakesleeanus NRRL 1555(-)]|uniref:Uncharacterized protein n=1 Tax=Phycomyces blakesleeanus (strain ATCC 8743b / DSM 1359 / FGSC 10004 / NBRC 33097 / NRRL 1555) TaxID=763407 RepID=A0A167QZJ2_PHYB8|nr:hypothetical protein PHYBLDRAFT_138076 [Phycomyces blakesleeanus NRRL 1555(-)]OAD80518.1 hypothetical protein PHYBLDRAFT_138076 [Phycomyces blakesleeanus NRRL 1555(-)]|eukprot:XP_018298558.1 hypothetical protein PHYBLDRAFT_138076 [Phycomyces blakesleeanus NRRL 1555(-)]